MYASVCNGREQSIILMVNSRFLSIVIACGGQILGKEKGAWTGHFEGERTGVKYLLKVTCTSASFQLRNHTHLDWLKGA